MKKIYNHILIILLVNSFLSGSSLVRSMLMPGWGETKEFEILQKDKNFIQIEDIKYIKKRSDALMLTEGVLWLSFFLINDFVKSYKSDYENYGSLYADVNWNGKTDLFAAHVGNYNSTEEYNDLVRQFFSPEDVYEGDEYQWNWKNNKSLRLKYDDMRNKSGQYDEAKKIMIACLAINRIVSVFDVIIIKNKHNKSFTFDYYEESNNKEMGLKINYHF